MKKIEIIQESKFKQQYTTNNQPLGHCCRTVQLATLTRAPLHRCATWGNNSLSIAWPQGAKDPQPTPRPLVLTYAQSVANRRRRAQFGGCERGSPLGAPEQNNKTCNQCATLNTHNGTYLRSLSITDGIV